MKKWRGKKRTRMLDRQMDLFEKKFSNMIDNAGFSDEEDRALAYLSIFGGYRHQDVVSIEEKQKHLNRKLNGPYAEKFLEWLTTGERDKLLPEEILNHGPEQRVKIIFKAIEHDFDTCEMRNYEILCQLNEVLVNCNDLSFIRIEDVSGSVKDLFDIMGNCVTDPACMTWQFLAIAVKLECIDTYFEKALEANDGTIKGTLPAKLAATCTPTKTSSNLKHKLMHALYNAHRTFDRKIIGKILDNPAKLGNSSFIRAIAKESVRQREAIADINAKNVRKSDSLDGVVRELGSAFNQ